VSGAPGALTGFTVGVTCARRADELGALLARRGATVVHGPAIQLLPLADDVELLMATRAVVERRIDIAVASTGVGFRGWLEAAEGWGLGEALINRLRGAVLLARGPKARGAIRAAGLSDSWSPESESVAELRDYLRIAVQLHGEPLPDFVTALTEAGAEVVTVPVYRWAPPADIGPLDRLIELTMSGGLDALTFTSAPAVAVVLERATQLGAGDELLRRLYVDVLAVCVGPITARLLVERGVPILQPARARLGSMVRELTDALPGRACRITAAGLELELRGRAVLVNGEPRPLPPAGMALLRALAIRPGHVVSRAELLTVLPGGGADEHAVETAVARLRTALGTPTVVQTVVKRGYRLAVA
jgi:uroporphyrinogen-III synthase